MSKNSILFLVQLPPPVHGAALRNEFLAKSRLLNDTFDIEVMPLNFARNIGDVGVFSLMKLIKMIGFAFRLFFKLLFKKPDLVYYNFAVKGIALYRDWLFIRIVKFFNIPAVLHLRTQGVREQAQSSTIKREIFKGAFRNTTIVCLSDRLALDIAEVYDAKPLIVANGIDIVVTDEDITKRKENSLVKFLFLSNLTKSKGVYEFIEALSVLKKNGHEFRAEIVGPEFDVTVSQLDQELKKSGLEEEVKIPGAVYGSDKFQKFISSDVFVFPTWFEAFPGVILEAMQSGLPCVSTKEGAIPEIIEDGKTGFLVEQKDVASLAEKMEVLLLDATRRKEMGIQARQSFLNSYTSTIFENKMEEVFNSI